jgi:hypothetical protein
MTFTRLLSCLAVMALFLPCANAGGIMTTVGFDIKPGSFPNAINLGSQGVLPTAILSSPNFYAYEVDPTTILFGDPALISNGGTAAPPAFTNEDDVNDDGMMDLAVFFDVPMLVSYHAIGDSSTSAVVTGYTFGGVGITGSDLVHTVPIPEPTTCALSLVGLCLVVRRHRKSARSHRPRSV